MNRYQHDTNVVIVNISDKFKQTMPYIIQEDGTVLGLNIKHRKRFLQGITVYWLTPDQAYDLARAQLKVQEIIQCYQKQITNHKHLLKALAYKLTQK